MLFCEFVIFLFIVLGGSFGKSGVCLLVSFGCNRLTNPFMFGITLNSYLSSMYNEMLQKDTNNVIVNMCTVCMLKKAECLWNT